MKSDSSCELLMGIDLSLNSTGLYFKYDKNDVTYNEYYILSNNRTQKSKSTIQHNVPFVTHQDAHNVNQLTIIDIHEVEGINRDMHIDTEKEKDKTQRIEMISAIIKNILSEMINKSDVGYCDFYKEPYKVIIGIEGIAFGTSSTTALCELAALNFMVRKNICDVLENKNYIIYIIPPSENKKFASGIGNADKNEMLFCWSHTDSGSTLYDNNLLNDIKIKLDDICDAYWLSHCAKNKNGENV